MADHNDPAINDAVTDLGYVARNLRHAGHDAHADAIDAVAEALRDGAPIEIPDLTTAPTAVQDNPPAGEPGHLAEVIPMAPQPTTAETLSELLEQFGDRVVVVNVDQVVDGLGVVADVEVFEPVTAHITFDPCPTVDDSDIHDALQGALETIGEYRYLEVDTGAGTATIEVTEPGDLPLTAGSVPVAGTAIIAGRATSVAVAIPDEDGNTAGIDDAFAAADAVLEDIAATATLFGETLPEAPLVFSVSYRRDGAPLDDDTIQPVLDVAAGTLGRFGELVATTITHHDDETIVDYAVLEAGAVSTAHLEVGTISWGGSLTIPGVGRVSAAIVRDAPTSAE